MTDALVTFTGNPKLAQLSLPKLTQTGAGDVIVTNNIALASFEAPALRSTAAVTCSSNSALERVVLGSSLAVDAALKV